MRRPHPRIDGPRGFALRWLAFDPQRPTRPRLARRFVITLVVLLALTAMLAAL